MHTSSTRQPSDVLSRIRSHLRIRVPLLLILLCVPSRTSSAQLLDWAAGAGGPGVDTATSVAVDGLNNTYVAGLFDGTITFGAGTSAETVLTGTDLPDVFLARYGPAGTFEWAVQTISETEESRRPGVAVDDAGYVYLMSRFQDTAVLGSGEPQETTLQSAGGSDVFLARYGADGQLAWVRQFGGSENDEGTDIFCCADGDVLVTGFIIGLATFGAGTDTELTLDAGNNGDPFVARFDAFGDFQDAFSIPGVGFDAARGIAAGDDFIVLTGSFMDDLTFGSGTPDAVTISAGVVDMFTARLTLSGTPEWVRQTSGSGVEAGTGISVDEQGNTYVSGFFESTITVSDGVSDDRMLSSNGGDDILVIKYSPIGAIEWARHAGSAGDDEASDIAADGLGGAYTFGSFRNTASFGPNGEGEPERTSAGGSDLFVANINFDGDFESVLAVGDGGDDVAVSGAVIGGRVMAAGSFENTVLFDAGGAETFTLESSGEADVFTMGLIGAIIESSEGLGVPDQQPVVQAFPNPARDRVTFSITPVAHGPVTLDLYDATGRLVFRTRPTAHGTALFSVDVYVSDLPSGTYFYRATGEQATRAAPLVITR